MKPLSNRQKAVLCQMARCAYDYQLSRGEISEADMPLDGAALRHLLRESEEPKRTAEAVLVRELSNAGLPNAYAEKISLNKFGQSIIDLDSRKLWQLIYTIRNRAAAKRRKSSAPPVLLKASTPN